MRGRHTQHWVLSAVIVGGIVSSGCAVRLVKRSPGDVERIAALNEQVQHFQSLSQAKGEEADQMRRAKEELEQRLAQEIKDKQVTVGMDERGIVVTFVAEVLFDSGKAKLRQEALPTLEKVATVLTSTVPEQPVGIEGHTDNEPIKHSGWRSNWELSTARATSVLHYLVDERRVTPERVAATGYGEYRPVVSNNGAEGRQKNRRVEIVILPKAMAKRTVTPLPATGEK